MEFVGSKQKCVCDCGASLEITPSMAAQVLGSVRTKIKAAAVRKNAQSPRPNARKPRKQKGVWAQLMDLPYHERGLIQAALAQLPRPGRPGRKKENIEEKS